MLILFLRFIRLFEEFSFSIIDVYSGIYYYWWNKDTRVKRAEENTEKRFQCNFLNVLPYIFCYLKRFNVLILELCFMTETAAISKWDSIEIVVFFLWIFAALQPLKQWLNRKNRKQVSYAHMKMTKKPTAKLYATSTKSAFVYAPYALCTHTHSLIKVMCVLPAPTLCLPFSADSVNEHWGREKKQTRTHVIPSTQNKLYFCRA